MSDEQRIAEWWDELKDAPIWSGAVQGTTWSDLWEGAREDLRIVYRAAQNMKSDSQKEIS